MAALPASSAARAADEQLGITPYTRDEPLLAALRASGLPQLQIYRLPAPVVVLGRGSHPKRELWLERCQADGAALQRRTGGGCAVVVDPGNVIVSLALPAQGIGGSPRYFAAISRWLSQALAELGAAGVCQQGHSDLVLGDQKIGGACIYRAKDLLYYSTTLLVTPAVALIERYLRHPPREPAYRQGRAHRAFLGALAELAGLPSAAYVERGLTGLLRLEALLP